MKQRCVLLVLALGMATPVSAQSISVPCGGAVQLANSSAALGNNGWLIYTVSTIVQLNLCVVGVTAEGRVIGVPGSSLYRWGTWSASAQKQVKLSEPGPYVTVGTHTYVFGIPPNFIHVLAGLTQSSVDVLWLAYEPQDCSVYNGGGNYYVWDENEQRCVEFMGSPIVVDTSGEGYQFTSLRNGVLFDLDGDGQLDKVAWTRRDAENAFLAFDRNGNGQIDDGTELFGNHTPVGTGGTAPNGFEALRFLETLPSDEHITRRDPIFDRLLLWTDRNHNGISEPEELQCLADAGVAAIGLNYKSIRRADRFGNEFRQVAKLKWVGTRQPTNIFDVWFRMR